MRHYANQCPEASSNANVNQQNATSEATANNQKEQSSKTENETDQAATSHVTITSWNCFASRNIKQGTALTTFKDKLRTWLLLDNQSTDNIFCNKDYLINIRKTNTTLDLTSNGGGLKTNLQGDFPGFEPVWYDPNGITNIVSQAIVEDMGYDVDYDKKKHQYSVTGKRGKIIFCKSPEGLYYMPLKPVRQAGVTLVETAEENKLGFTK